MKRKFDPDYVFTANGLGVDASNAPADKCLLIKEIYIKINSISMKYTINVCQKISLQYLIIKF